MEKKDDGVQRDRLDYRAGFVEGLEAFLLRLQVASIRAKKTEFAGMEVARQLAVEIRKGMLDKMRGKP